MPASQTDLHSYNSLRAAWRKEFKRDRKMGGKNVKRTVAKCGALIERFGGTEKQLAALRGDLRITGSGDSPNLIRLLYRLAKHIESLEERRLRD